MVVRNCTEMSVGKAKKIVVIKTKSHYIAQIPKLPKGLSTDRQAGGKTSKLNFIVITGSFHRVFVWVCSFMYTGISTKGRRLGLWRSACWCCPFFPACAVLRELSIKRYCNILCHYFYYSLFGQSALVIKRKCTLGDSPAYRKSRSSKF